MLQFLIKIILSALIIAAASEAAKRFAVVGAILISLPLVSMLAIIWLYRETADIQKIIGFSHGVFWAVLPSLLFFVVLPLFLKAGWKFYGAMAFSSAIMALAYVVYAAILNKFGIKI